MRVKLSKGAKRELADAELRYDEAREGLGSEFYEAVLRAVAEIAQYPLRWPKEEIDVRRFVVERFPYRIFYQVRKNEVVVVAIMHTSRSPGYWRGRVTKK
jgi:plasmid stabilization system protein ParE